MLICHAFVGSLLSHCCGIVASRVKGSKAQRPGCTVLQYWMYSIHVQPQCKCVLSGMHRVHTARLAFLRFWRKYASVCWERHPPLLVCKYADWMQQDGPPGFATQSTYDYYIWRLSRCICMCAVLYTRARLWRSPSSVNIDRMQLLS